MDKNIKERWKAIDQGLVPKGYKKTKVGIVPDDWDVKNFSELFKVSQGLQIPIKDRLSSDGEDRYIYITNELINNLKNKNYNIEYIEKPNSNVISNKEDILMTRTGNTGIVVSGIEGVFHNNFFKIRYDEETINRLFLIYRLKSDDIQHEIKKLAGTSTIPDLTHGDFYSLDIAFPEISEQERIADILFTWDKSIESYGKLLEEKKERKEGLMQLLLTGGKRLGGFSGFWKEIRLGDVIEEINERTTEDNQYEILTSAKEGLFLQSEYFNKQVASQKTIGYKVLKNGQFTFRTMSDTGFFKFNRLSKIKIGIVSPAYVVFDIKDGFDSKFFYYIMNTNNFLYKIKKFSQGGTRIALRFNNLIKIKIRIPDLEEQKAIAEVLATADEEIDLLEKLIEELEEEKKGLMQLLLKGIVRV